MHDGATRYDHTAGINSGANVAFMEKTDHTYVQQLSRPGHSATVTSSIHWTATGCIFDIQAVVQ